MATGQSVQKLGKNTTNEYSLGMVVARDVAAADSGALAPSDLLLPGISTTLAASFDAIANGQGSGLINCEGARHVRLRFFAAAAAATGTGRMILCAYPYNSQRALSGTDKTTVVQGKGDVIFDATLLFAGSQTANINPVTGEAVASTTFYEASSVSATTAIQESRVRWSSSAGTTSELSVVVDVMGARRLYPHVKTLGGGATPSRVIVAYQLLD